MRILFLHANTPDYLSAGLFHGLRTLLGKDCVDLPRFDCMYKPMPDGIREKIRGRGFTLYGLLPDDASLAVDRFFIWEKNIADFDLYIIADIWRQWPEYQRLRTLVPASKIVVIDPADTPRVFPYNSYKQLMSTDKAKLLTSFKNVRYYKRELSEKVSDQTGYSRPLHYILRQLLATDIRPIQFAIPAEKIYLTSLVHKQKLFTSNIVDEEIAKGSKDSHFIPLGEQSYNFTSEESYYEDIRISKYGITGKRAGWDCLRHYEFAANGAVLCFKNLQDKEKTSAPHGLDRSNCIVYKSYSDLQHQLKLVDDVSYSKLLQNSYKWIQQHTTIALATNLLDDK